MVHNIFHAYSVFGISYKHFLDQVLTFF